MTQKRRRYDEAFKKRAVRMSYNSDRSIKSVAESIGITSAMLYRWREIYTAEGVKREAAEQNDEIKVLKAKLRELEEENDMLKKAHDFFTKNQG